MVAEQLEGGRWRDEGSIWDLLGRGAGPCHPESENIPGVQLAGGASPARKAGPPGWGKRPQEKQVGDNVRSTASVGWVSHMESRCPVPSGPDSVPDAGATSSRGIPGDKSLASAMAQPAVSCPCCVCA